jgi:hypothetical protein
MKHPIILGLIGLNLQSNFGCIEGDGRNLGDAAGYTSGDHHDRERKIAWGIFLFHYYVNDKLY